MRILSAVRDYEVPDSGFDLPQIGGLSDECGAVTQIGKEVLVMAVKIVKEVFIQMMFEISAADFHRDDLFVSQCGSEAAASDGILSFD